MDMSQYLDLFIDESKEHLQAINERLLELEKTPEDMSVVNDIFRSAHTLKGMSATMGFEDLANLTHQMENVLDGIRNRRLSVTPELLDVIFEAVDHLEAMISSIAAGGDGTRDVRRTVEQLKRIEQGEMPNKQAAREEPPLEHAYGEFEYYVLEQAKEQGFSVYEIRVRLRDDCLLKAARVYMVFEQLNEVGEIVKAMPPVEMLEEEQFDREFLVTVVSKAPADELQKRLMGISEIDDVKVSMLSSNEPSAESEKASAPQQPAAMEQAEAVQAEAEAPEKQTAKQATKTIRVNIERLDMLMNLFEELVVDRGRLEQISRELNHAELTETVERMSRISSDLQTIILNMRMVPVETVFNRFPRMVRQLARELGKKVRLDVIGAETELDRTVIDEIGDPLVHLLRNALDHGIEAPDVRAARGKPEEGTIQLRAYHSGNHVFIEIEDDGAGISREKVLKKAISRGIVSPEEAEHLTDEQVYELIFAPGFSTADHISDISGRGVGLDVVKSTIESLGGTVAVDSRPGQGSLFSIQLPLTLSIISVLLVQIAAETYAIPLSSIMETALIRKEDVFYVHNQPVIDFRGKVVPLVRLKDVFAVPGASDDSETVPAVIVRKGEKLAALAVDSFIGQQEVVLKSLGNYLSSVFAISGATILGDGRVALIIDCNALVK
ncbi:chemotaxis protein CheA [Geobacillus sp. FSL K6-0789]|uniref:Chemotaxis protein CheA n=1 Tax=Geobacillus stearothermophilus TaxID=1422 RepID=A0A3L7DHL6_GEOSE|nr:chemotaxis protein CheA [Geobacillus stearothermophilus]KMY61081.1 chemotaxis protein CheA [Geobacillus stearothermophilus]KMY62273.1 chemotaxis protein CheA [Geobacillus stearothermophilus]KOR94858.1 chemotaxis protein CheA [Geobacillus stearothermophilus ATCC 12980]MED3732015.1 chemotaxis protein CheA [Geobacillus stearothermophilus]MED3750070.1 chemotaxis protein CheA [Geobacillus stearothermophilus]